jgi:hypothetical protein
MQALKTFPVGPLTIDTGSGGPLTAQPGSLVRGQVDLVELADGTPVRFPIVLVNGSKPGPRFYLGAAIPATGQRHLHPGQGHRLAGPEETRRQHRLRAGAASAFYADHRAGLGS